MRLATSVVVAATVSLIGCGKVADDAAQIESLLQADRDWAAAAAAGDVQRLAGFWTENAVNFFPGAPPARGKQAIRELVTKNRSRPGFSLTWEPTHAVVAEAADIGYTWGAFQLSAEDSTGNVKRREGNYVAIWRKQADGSWKCEVESTIFTG